jgi:hypothetical protein
MFLFALDTLRVWLRRQVVVTVDAGNPEWLDNEEGDGEDQDQGEDQEQEPRDSHVFYTTVCGLTCRDFLGVFVGGPFPGTVCMWGPRT